MNLELVEQNMEEIGRQIQNGDVLLACRSALLIARLLFSQAECEPKRAAYGACVGAGSELAALFEKIKQDFEPAQETEKLQVQLEKLHREFQEEEKTHQELLEQEEQLRNASVRLADLKKRLAELAEIEAALCEFSDTWAEDSRLIGQMPDSVGAEEVDRLIQTAKGNLEKLRGQVREQEEELREILQQLRRLYPAEGADE